MNQPVIEFSNFSFTYHNADSESLTGIDFIIRKGEFILLTGHSGCGKTTLTRCINGLIPDFFEGDLSGECRVCGMDIAEHETGEFSPLVGSVFQDPRSQFFTLHVKTEIPFPSENLGTPMDKMQEQYEKAVDVLQIQGLLGKSIFDLSSGEKQKVAIASIYMVGVGIYVLDEPSANLDSEGTEQLRQVLKSLKEQGNTIIISEHTIGNNIRYGRENATQEEIEAAAKLAHCHDFIMALPDGYDTMVGEGGSTLSGGEKQRISIARAILKDAPVLLLDEATSSLDPENEVEVQQAIEELVKDRTVVMIAHKLKTIAGADQIIVLDQGEVKEVGTHKELMDNHGLYRHLWDIQQTTAGWQIN